MVFPGSMGDVTPICKDNRRMEATIPGLGSSGYVSAILENERDKNMDNEMKRVYVGFYGGVGSGFLRRLGVAIRRIIVD